MAELKKIVLKPTVFCYHKCPYCDLRQDFYKEMLRAAKDTARQNQPGQMPLDVALTQVREAYALGMRECLLSGGDPLLYDPLIDLIKGARAHSGVFVFMNSVGTGLTAERGLDILDAGLGAWNFSVDTLEANRYDSIRGVKGAFQQVMNALDVLLSIRRNHPRHARFWINFMTVITRHNYRDLPALFRFSVNRGIASIYLMNVYGDDQNKAFLLSRDQIGEFREVIAPAIVDALEEAGVEDIVKENAKNVLNTFYSPDNSLENYENGIWWKDFESARLACTVPESYALIEADGKVLPCCLMEIAHEGIVGNIRERTLTDVWSGDEFQNFRDRRVAFCQKCPVPRHRTVGLVPEMCRQFIG